MLGWMELTIRFQRDLIDKSNEVDYLLSGNSITLGIAMGYHAIHPSMASESSMATDGNVIYAKLNRYRYE